ncbi:50S ribosomal protein L28 [Patescibacteria group bacterium]|nr:50S ribosomal protein L28 [Patescibacteria group bacterium]
MVKQCPICDKKTITGGKYSNRVRATQFNPTGKKKRYPNLQWAQLPACSDKTCGKRIKICTSCLKKGLHLKKKK